MPGAAGLRERPCTLKVGSIVPSVDHEVRVDSESFPGATGTKKN